MKKRIIGLVLVVVMLALSLVGCGYSIANDDLTAYATFSAEDKAAFEAKLEKILIEDGDFTEDDAVRAKKVLETIYSKLAAAADTDDKKTEGTFGAHDLVFYCHYVTAEFDGKTEYFYMTEMKTANADKLQLGVTDEDDEVASAIRAAIGGFTFTNDTVYKSEETGTAAVGDVVFVTYTYSYVETAADGTEKEIKDTITNEMMVVTDNNDIFSGRLNGKTVGSTIEDFDLEEEGRGNVDYSGVKINWIGKGAELTSFKDITYDEDKNVNNTAGDTRNLKDVELTYHVYPTHYVSVDEFTALNVVNVILGDSISESQMVDILFGSDYVGLDETDDEDKAKLDELETLLKAYETKDENGKTVTFAELLSEIADLQAELEDAEEELDKKNTDLKTKTDAYDKAKKTVDEAGESATADQKSALEKAENAKKLSEDDQKKAQETYDKAKKDRDDNVTKLFAFEDMENKIVNGYKVSTYNTLQTSYNNEIKMNLATEIYFFLTEAIKVNGAPEKAVDEAYEALYEKYESDFYTGNYDTSNKITNYKQYNGSFKKYLIAKVTKDIATVTTYKDALAKLREEALEYVQPIVRIYVVAKAYGDEVFVSDAEFEKYKDDPKNSFSYYEYYYGENNVRYAHQFDELLDYFLESEEVKAEEKDENGYTKITFDYKKLGYEFGEPLSEAKPEEEEKSEETKSE